MALVWVYLNGREYLRFAHRDIAEKWIENVKRKRADGTIAAAVLAADDPEASYGARQEWEIVEQ